ncbi:MAG: hypothetical protein WA952_01565 [Lewinella sp.]
MRQTLFLCCLFLTTVVCGQVGVTGFYNFNDARAVGDGVDPNAENDLMYGNGPEIALNYWFRLPKNRIEFQPTVYYTQAGDTGWREAGFQFKTNIYVFDLGTDCDCPTFGKQGPQLEKGFYLQLSPGVSRHWADLPIENGSGRTAFTLGAGVGIDFGISNLITLTPIAAIRHTVTDFTGLTFTDLDGEALDVRGKLTAFQLGLQATFRFDKKRY